MPAPPDEVPRPADRPLHALRRLLWLGLGLAAYASSLLLARIPHLAEALYGIRIGPIVVGFLAALTGWIPFSLGELLVVAYILYQVGALGRAGAAIRRGERSPGNALACGSLRLARDLGFLLTLFYLSWGFNYSRPPLEAQLGWPRPDSATVEEVSALVRDLVEASNREYVAIHGSGDAGTPTDLPGGRVDAVRTIRAAWSEARGSLGLPPSGGGFGRVKTPLLTAWYEWVGVAGFYFPFTAEPHVRAGIPAVDLGKILAHEIAHQQGVSGEAEANFWGFLAAGLSSDPHLRYSAFVFAQQQLLGALARADRDAARSLMEGRLPGVLRDLEDSAEYWRRTRGSGVHVGRALNDAYLRTNRVEGGVRDYSRSALLLLAYARARNGRILP